MRLIYSGKFFLIQVDLCLRPARIGVFHGRLIELFFSPRRRSNCAWAALLAFLDLLAASWSLLSTLESWSLKRLPFLMQAAKEEEERKKRERLAKEALAKIREVGLRSEERFNGVENRRILEVPEFALVHDTRITSLFRDAKDGAACHERGELRTCSCYIVSLRF